MAERIPVMEDSFKEYVCAEVAQMCKEMNDTQLCDPQQRRKFAIEWVEKNAVKFRLKWQQKHSECAQ